MVIHMVAEYEWHTPDEKPTGNSYFVIVVPLSNGKLICVDGVSYDELNDGFTEYGRSDENHDNFWLRSEIRYWAELPPNPSFSSRIFCSF